MPFDELRHKYATKTHSEEERQLQRIRFGECLVNVPVKSITSILMDEVLNPFYIFQVFSMAVFVWEGYRIYAGCIFVLSALSIMVTIYETRMNNESIRKLAKYVCPVRCMKVTHDGAALT